jgi:mannose-6-phosphate isomerase-like protein (cupin superfamily)
MAPTYNPHSHRPHGGLVQLGLSAAIAAAARFKVCAAADKRYSFGVTGRVAIVVAERCEEGKMNSLIRSHVFRLAQVHASIPGPSGERSTLVLKRGTCDVKLARPIPPNEQAPHTQDELYIIVRGRGILLHDGKRDSFETGDLLFVAAGVEHRFEGFTEDFAIWRIFYGALGGEVPSEFAPTVRQ